VSTRYSSIRPGQVGLDTTGHRIQAHGGSISPDSDRYYWYGENKERTTPGSGIWHWGVRCYESTDLYNWTDLGLLIPPHPDVPESSLHPARVVDRPHIVRSRSTGSYVRSLKVMYEDGTQRSTVLTAERFLGPYTVVRTDLRPLGMSAGNFDLVVDPHDGKFLRGIPVGQRRTSTDSSDGTLPSTTPSTSTSRGLTPRRVSVSVIHDRRGERRPTPKASFRRCSA
jgi:hypothetical protein